MIEGFRIKKTSKPVLDKVSVKLLMTPKERVLFDEYSERSGIDKTAIATKAVNLFIRGDSYFKGIIKKDKVLKTLIDNAKPLEAKVKAKAKKTTKAKTRKAKAPKVIAPVKPFGTL